MSTLKVAAINNPSASSGGLAISTGGNVTGAGLDLITTQSFSAASSVSVNNCFTATYDNYRVVVQSITPSANNYLGYRHRVSGADNSTANYRYAIGQVNWAGTMSPQTSGTGQTFARLALLSGSNATMGLTIDVINPQRTDYTVLTGTNTNDGQIAFCGSWFNGTTAFDGFTIYSEAASTLTGSLSVYGYKK